ncbi:MAG: 1-deoxy-D-xylulose-5-phosphate synthase [Ruminococcaceae bacterium]|nr:1-deoxy-D-xylulose-5-phosphate synthase [Oscillospiraceae bacterium]
MGDDLLILERIYDPKDVKDLNDEEARVLCGELREFLLGQVSRTGGHLASNLGVVELTVAIHRVFDTARDRLVFDVGHQCYVHKALTGRRAMFDTLRQFQGLSGFPKPYESEHDAFIAGHASNSVSVALGMARARTQQKEDYHVLALTGDGALTGGLSFEGLNDAGASREPLIVILNDNGMSIDANVGGMSSHLSHLRTKPGYNALKKRYRQALTHSNVGTRFYNASRDVKQFLKKSLLPESTMFEDMGFHYMGPVDGHDVEELTNVLQWAKEQRSPVLVHVNTVKGKGYSFAEQEPNRFHGVSPFDVQTGKPLKSGGASYSSVFGEALTELAAEDERICAISAAMVDGTGLTPFAKAFPDRFFDVGISEGHAVAMAAGIAKQGSIPVFAVYSSFLQRGFDMLLHDVALSGLHVVLAVDRAGLVGADGETHHGCFDPNYLAQIPGMTVLCPASFAELRSMLRKAVLEIDGPVAIRYPRGGEEAYHDCCGGEAMTTLHEGSECTIVSYGTLINEALKAADILQEKGISASVVKLNRIAPLTGDDLKPLHGGSTLLVLEDCVEAGCVGQRLAALLLQSGIAPKRLILKNSGSAFVQQGSVPQLYHALGLDGEGVAATLEEVLRGF